ncbi:MAG: class I SAM-dependent methyltransferase, partial [Chitinophagaceae bacterium]
FIKKLIARLQPPPGSRMLDVACGKGRHSKILASLGFRVTGIDLSPDSIAYARQFIQEETSGEKDNPDFFIHDMRLPFWINYFDYAFNFFTSFGYFNTRREHDDALRTIANSLKPGGVLVMDYLNVHYAEHHLVHHEMKQLGETVYEIRRWDDDSHFYKKITVTDPGLSIPFENTERVAKFSIGDFTEMFAYQEMQIQEVFGDYLLSKFDTQKSPRLIIVATKPGN